MAVIIKITFIYIYKTHKLR